MTSAGFLALAVLLSIAGSVVLWARSRRPTSIESGIDDFQREMRALAPLDGDESDTFSEHSPPHTAESD